MADVKITELTALASANVVTSSDVVPIVDASVPQTKKITVDNLVAPITLDKSNSRIGIGETSPDEVVHIKNANAAIKYESTAGSGYTWNTGNIVTNGNFTFSSNTTNNVLTLANDGNIGINEDAPITKLDLRLDSGSGDLTADYAMYINNQTGAVSGRHATIGFGTYNNGGLTNVFGAVAEGVGAQSGFAFLTHNGGALTEKVRIANDGKVGFGTDSPRNTIHSTGIVEISNASSNSDTERIRFGRTDDNQRYSSITHKLSDSSQNNHIAFKMHNGSSQTETLRIRGDGVVGIRTSNPNVGGWSEPRGVLTISSEDNASANNYAVLELQGHSFNSSGINGLIMFLDHTTENARIQSNRTDSASYGDLRFHTKAGGSLEEHMRIRASGNIWFQGGSEFRTASHGGVDRIGMVDMRDESGYDPVLHVMSDRDSGAFTGIRVTAGLDSPASAGDCVYMDFFDGDGGHRGGIQCGSTTANPEFFNGSSDERVKTNIVDTSTNGLNIINGLELKDFTMQKWFAGTSQNVTCDFVAQNAEEHFPAMVSEHKVEPLNDEYRQSFIDAGIESEEIETATGTKEKFVVKTVAHGSLIPILVKAIQELSDKVETLENA